MARCPGGAIFRIGVQIRVELSEMARCRSRNRRSAENYRHREIGSVSVVSSHIKNQSTLVNIR
jgi:hypothetical protein